MRFSHPLEIKTGWVLLLRFAFVFAALITGCNGQCDRVTKVLTATLDWRELSPELDNNGQYLPSQICHWRLQADAGHVVQVNVQKMDLENAGPGSTVCYDSVSLFDNSDLIYASRLVVMCRLSDVGREFYSSWQNMFVRFESDPSTQKTGFVLRYRAVPFGDLPFNVSTVKPQDDQEDDPESDSSVNMSTIMGGIAGGSIAVVCIVALVFVCSRYFHNRNDPHRREGLVNCIGDILTGNKVTPSTGRIGNARSRRGRAHDCSSHTHHNVGHSQDHEHRHGEYNRSQACSGNQESFSISDRTGVPFPRTGPENASGRSIHRHGQVIPSAPPPEHIYRDGNDFYNDRTIDNQHSIPNPNSHGNTDPDALTSRDGRGHFPGSHLGPDRHHSQITSPPFRGNLHVDPSIIGDAPPPYESVVSNQHWRTENRGVASSEKEPPSYSNDVETET